MLLYCRYSGFQLPWELPLELELAWGLWELPLELELAWGSLA